MALPVGLECQVIAAIISLNCSVLLFFVSNMNAENPMVSLSKR